MLFEKPRGGFTNVMSLAGGAATAASSIATAVTVAAAIVAAAALTDGKLLTLPVLLPFLILRLMFGLLLLLALLLQTTTWLLDLLSGAHTGVLVQRPARLLCISCILPALILLVLKLPSIFQIFCCAKLGPGRGSRGRAGKLMQDDLRNRTPAAQNPRCADVRPVSRHRWHSRSNNEEHKHCATLPAGT